MQKQEVIVPPPEPEKKENSILSKFSELKQFAQEVILPKADKYFHFAALTVVSEKCTLDQKSKKIIEEIKSEISENNFELPNDKKYLVAKLFFNLGKQGKDISITRDFIVAFDTIASTEETKESICAMLTQNINIPLGHITGFPMQGKYLFPIYIARNDSTTYPLDLVFQRFLENDKFKRHERYPENLYAALQYLAEVKDLKLDDTFIKRMQDVRTEILKFNKELAQRDFPQASPEALENIVSPILYAFDSGLQEVIGKKNLKDGLEYLQTTYPPGHYARKGALLEILDTELIKEYSIVDLIFDRVSLDTDSTEDTLRPHLSDTWKNDALKGCDHLYAEILIKKIAKTPEQEKELQSIKMPILNLLTEIYLYNPDRFEEISESNPEVLNKITEEIAKKVQTQRVEFIKKNDLLFDKKANFLGAIHSDFQTQGLEELIDRFQMEKKLIIQGGEAAGENALKKDAFFTALKEICINTDGFTSISPIFLRNHGGPQHSWISRGRLGEEKSEVLEHPNAISFKELALNVIQAHKENNLKEVDLKHLRLFVDECDPEDYAWHFHKSLVKEAKEEGMTIKSFPLVVAATQWGMNSFASFGIPPVRSSMLEHISRLQLSKGESFKTEHLLQIDEISNKDLETQNKTAIDNFRTYLNPLVHVSDPAIFDTKTTTTKEMLGDLIHLLDIDGVEYIKAGDIENAPIKFEADEIRPIQVGSHGLSGLSNIV